MPFNATFNASTPAVRQQRFGSAFEPSFNYTAGASAYMGEQGQFSGEIVPEELLCSIAVGQVGGALTWRAHVVRSRGAL